MAKESILDFLRLNRKYLVSGTAQETGLSSNSIDLITSPHVFRHFKLKDFISAVNELHRVLKPGGRIIITPITNDDAARKIFEQIQNQGIAIKKIEAFPEYRAEGPQIGFEIQK